MERREDSIERARRAYRPNHIKCLLLAESPPKNGRFFYFPDSTRFDFLFINVMDSLYSDFKGRYRNSKEKPKIKSEFLNRFKGDGFYLHDVYSRADEISRLSPKSATERLIDDLKNLNIGRAPIIIVKASVFDLAALPLCKAGFDVVDARVPFPAQGNQAKFLTEFRNALKETGWNNRWSGGAG